MPPLPSSVVTVTVPTSRLATISPKSRSARRGADDDLDRRAVGQQRLRERDQRRRAVPAADEDRRRRRRTGSGTACRAGRRCRGRRRCGAGSASACRRRARRRRTGSCRRTRRRASRCRARTRGAAASRCSHRRRRPRRTAPAAPPWRCRRDDGELEVLADPLHREDLALFLHRAHRVPRQSASCRCRSCSERTPMSPRTSSSMPWTAAAAACTVVRHGMPAVTAAVRIS